MKQPEFTIITPCLNYGRFLRDCLESVSAQMGVSVEHLVMDGGSKDESAEIAADYSGVEFHQEPDKGMSDAINKGFDRAKGKWVMWLNADDRLRKDVLREMRDHLETTDADIVYGDWNFISESGDHLKHVRSVKWSQFVNVHHHCFVASTAGFYRRETVLDEGHRLREDFHYVMDGEFYARLHSLGKRFVHVPVDVADFRLHEANASMRHLAKSQDLDQILLAERQHVESRAIRRAYGVTLFSDPYLNGIVDGILWIVAKGYKGMLKLLP